MVERHKLLRRKPRKKASKPNRKKLTEANVRTLPAKRKQYLVWDDTTGRDAANGLAVLVSPRGIRSFRCVYYFPGSPKPHWKHLGRVAEVTLDEARQKTVAARRMARNGEDPKADNPRKSDSFKALVGEYTQDCQLGERENRSAHDTEAVILSRTKDWHARPVATIRRDEIKNLLRQVRDGDKERRATPYMANRLHSHLKDFFDWCADPDGAGQLKESSMAGMKKPWKKEEPRNRVWFNGKPADAMIRKVWGAADEIGGEEGRYLKLLVLTGKRPWGRANGNGLGAMRWEDIDEDWFWDPPKSRTDNKRLNGVPLTRIAQEILGERRKQGYVFPEEWTEDNTHRLRVRVRRMTAIDDFILHGIRHVVETKLETLRDKAGKLVAPPHVRDLLLDHAATSGTGKVYSHSELRDYSRDMLAAADAWASFVAKLVTSGGAEGVRVERRHRRR